MGNNLRETLVLVFTLAVIFVLMYFLEFRYPQVVKEFDEMSACGILNMPNQVYVLDNDLQTTSSCFSIQANNITLDFGGHRITGDGDYGEYGVYVGGYNDTKIKNGILDYFSVGIFINESAGSLVSDMQVERSLDSALVLYSSFGALIQDNLFLSNSYQGIKVVFGGNHRMRQNTVHGSGDSGILVQNSDSNILIGNIVSENNWNGIYLYQSRHHLLSRNYLRNNSWNGISFVSSSFNVLVGNTLDKNARGIYLFLSDRNNFSQSRIIDSKTDTGIYLSHADFNSFFNTSIIKLREEDYAISMVSSAEETTSYNSFSGLHVEPSGKDIYSKTNMYSVNQENHFLNAEYGREVLVFGGRNTLIRSWDLEIVALEDGNPIEAYVEIRDNFGGIVQEKTDAGGLLKRSLVEYIRTPLGKKNYFYRVSVIYQGKSISRLITMNEEKREVFEF